MKKLIGKYMDVMDENEKLAIMATYDKGGYKAV